MLISTFKYHITSLVVAALKVLYLFFFVTYLVFCILPVRTANPDNSDKIPGLSYSLNLPLHAGSLLSVKIDYIITYLAKTNRNLFTQFSSICADDKIYDLILNFNNNVFQSIQLGTTTEFNCELQI